MMKKLLVLMLVLGMASLANAGLSLTVPAEVDVADGTYSVILAGDAADAFGGGVYASPFPSARAATGAIITGSLGNAGSTSAFDDGFFDGWEVETKEVIPSEAGDFISTNWSVEYTGIPVGANGSSQVFDLYDYGVSFETPIAQGTTNFVPEPMTMVLLGLGGLFLRRRK